MYIVENGSVLAHMYTESAARKHARVLAGPGCIEHADGYRAGGSPVVYRVRELTPAEAGATVGTDVAVCWPEIHAAFHALDTARAWGTQWSGVRVGHDGVTDALGGSYRGYHYEARGLRGVVQLIAAAQRIRDAAWRMLHDTGSAARRTRSRAERKRLIETARHLCCVVVALRDTARALAATGLMPAADQHTICGTDGGTVGVTGLSWLAGAEREDRVTPWAALEAFASSGDVTALRAAMGVATHDASQERI